MFTRGYSLYVVGASASSHKENKMKYDEISQFGDCQTYHHGTINRFETISRYQYVHLCLLKTLFGYSIQYNL